MLNRSEHLEAKSLSRLHRDLIGDRERIRDILDRLEREQVVLRRGLTAAVDREAGVSR